jgi:hypothetical protein
VEEIVEFRPQIKELETPPAAYLTSPNGIDKIDVGVDEVEALWCLEKLKDLADIKTVEVKIAQLCSPTGIH